jgi:hypothetical protein
MRSFLIRVFLNFYSIISIFIINKKIFFLKKKTKNKIIFFYYPSQNISPATQDYIQDYFKQFKDCVFIYSSSSHISSLYRVIKPSYLKFIFGVDLFISNYVCDNFTNNSQKMYMHHDIYDTPLLSKDKEKNLIKRLDCYDHILIPSVKSIPAFTDLYKKKKTKPSLIILGEYPKLTFWLEKIKKIKKKNKSRKVIVATSGFFGVPELSVKNYLIDIIKILTDGKIKTVFRPHPSNVSDKEVRKIKFKFENNKFFELDETKDYTKKYFDSSLMITDYSGTAYTYALMTLNPVIFFSPNERYVYKSGYSKLNYFKDREKIGFAIKKNTFDINFINKAYKNKDKFSKNIKNLRNKFFIKKNVLVLSDLINANSKLNFLKK